eukprot:scaffold44465_cov191-Amphora_coffeaeformis.AAC.1
MDTFVNIASTSLEAKPSSSSSSSSPKSMILLEKPKRPLSGYNIFFRDERQKLLQELVPRKRPSTSKNGRNSHYKIAFDSLAKTISARWQTLDTRIKQEYEDLAQRGREHYFKKARAWKEQQKALGLSTKIQKRTKGSSKKPPKANKSPDTKRTQAVQVPVGDWEPLPFANERNNEDLREPIAFGNATVPNEEVPRELAAFSNWSTRNTQYPHEPVLLSDVIDQNAAYLRDMSSFSNFSNPSATQSPDANILFMVNRVPNGVNAHDTEAQVSNLQASDLHGPLCSFPQDVLYLGPYQGTAAQSVSVAEGWVTSGQEAFEPCERTQYSQMFCSS